MLDPRTGNFPTNKSDLEALVAANADALELARAGMQKKCRVHLDDNPLKRHDVKILERGFEAEGQLAELQGHPNEAAGSFLDIVHLANESSRGGVLIDALIEMIIEREGTDALQKLLPQLDAQTCRQAAATLETLDAQRQTWEDIEEQESEWSHHTFPGLKDELVRLANYKAFNKAERDFERKFQDQQIRTQRLIIDLAARAYSLDNGHAPASVAALVPNYLKAIPQDPLTGTNMVY